MAQPNQRVPPELLKSSNRTSTSVLRSKIGIGLSVALASAVLWILPQVLGGQTGSGLSDKSETQASGERTPDAELAAGDGRIVANDNRLLATVRKDVRVGDLIDHLSEKDNLIRRIRNPLAILQSRRLVRSIEAYQSWLEKRVQLSELTSAFDLERNSRLATD